MPIGHVSSVTTGLAASTRTGCVSGVAHGSSRTRPEPRNGMLRSAPAGAGLRPDRPVVRKAEHHLGTAVPNMRYRARCSPRHDSAMTNVRLPRILSQHGVMRPTASRSGLHRVRHRGQVRADVDPRDTRMCSTRPVVGRQLVREGYCCCCDLGRRHLDLIEKLRVGATQQLPCR